MAKTILGAAVVGLVLLSGEAPAQTPIPPSPKDFVMSQAQGDHYEILAAEVALVRGQDPRVVAFATRMIDDHRHLLDGLRQAAVAADLPPPPSGLSSDQASLLGALQGVGKDDFDRAYARQQVLAHAQAVAVEESFADGGVDPGLKSAAQTALPTIRDHLKQAEALYGALGGS